MADGNGQSSVSNDRRAHDIEWRRRFNDRLMAIEAKLDELYEDRLRAQGVRRAFANIGKVTGWLFGVVAAASALVAVVARLAGYDW